MILPSVLRNAVQAQPVLRGQMEWRLALNSICQSVQRKAIHLQPAHRG